MSEDPFGVIRAHLEKHADKERAMFSVAGMKALLDAVERAPVSPAWKPTHQHLKRRSFYRFVGKATLQASTSLRDMDTMVIYQAEDGSFWVRPDAEFYDGRFLLLADGGAE